ncbi:MAG: LysR substrate-binding domain-containing protein [Verrucomicrobiota bacterium]
MEFHRIRYFLEVARTGNFSRAAVWANISQPSLSQQIHKLEDEVGESLFVRARDGVTLSEFGKAFLPHAKAIMEEVESAREFVDRSGRQLSGPIRIGAIPTIAPYLLPELLRQIVAKYPTARFELMEETTDALIDRLRTGAIDFALMSPPTKVDADTDQLRLQQDELLLTLPQDHPLCDVEKIDLKQLRGERLVLLKEAHCLSRQSEGFCKASGLKADVSIRSSQIDTLLGMVELGLGFTFTPKMAVDFHRHRKVIYRSLQQQPYLRDICLYWMRRRMQSASQQAIVECLSKGRSKNEEGRSK